MDGVDDLVMYMQTVVKYGSGPSGCGGSGGGAGALAAAPPRRPRRWLQRQLRRQAWRFSKVFKCF